tara:strand:- start:42 stop:260 length:219 start_codon:yes stop_codon:yes gene_type:complete
MTPLYREGAAVEIANTAAFVATSETSFIIRVNIDINGGLVLSYIIVGVNRDLTFSGQLISEDDIIGVKKKLI